MVEKAQVRAAGREDVVGVITGRQVFCTISREGLEVLDQQNILYKTRVQRMV